MEFTFSIRNAIREAWEIFKKHYLFFIGVAGVSVLLSFISNNKHVPGIISFILSIANFIWSIVVIKFALATVDKKFEKLSFSSVKEMLPNWNQAIGMLGVSILTVLLVFGGLILIIIPGLWIAFRLSVANFSFIDKGQGVLKSLRNSWDMTQGGVFWTAVLVAIVSGCLYLVGFLLFGVGILITYPLAMILMAKFYRALTVHHGVHSHTEVVVQPAEILAPEPEVHSESEMKDLPAQAGELHQQSDTQNQ